MGSRTRSRRSCSARRLSRPRASNTAICLTHRIAVATLPLVGAVALPGVVTSAAAEPVVAEQGAAAGSGQISSASQGTLSWVCEQSFRNYLTGPIAGGHYRNLDGIGFTGGAKTEDGAFQFSADPAGARRLGAWLPRSVTYCSSSHPPPLTLLHHAPTPASASPQTSEVLVPSPDPTLTNPQLATDPQLAHQWPSTSK